jgi:hypothetical protein
MTAQMPKENAWNVLREKSFLHFKRANTFGKKTLIRYTQLSFGAFYFLAVHFIEGWHLFEFSDDGSWP